MREKYKNFFIIAVTGVFLLAFGILFFFLIFRAGNVFSAIGHLFRIMMPFIYGMVIAYLLRPICNQYEKGLIRLQKKIKPRHPLGKNALLMIAILLSFLSAFVILYILLSSVLPQLAKSIVRLSYAIPGYVQAVEEGLSRLFEDNAVLTNYLGTSFDSVMEAIQDWTKLTLIPAIRGMMGNFSDGLFNILSVMSNLLIGMIAAVYMLANRRRFVAQAKMILYSICNYETAHWIESEMKYADQMFVGFLGGKIVDSTIIGIICFIGCTIMQIPNTLLVSVIVGVTNIIPFFGPYIGLVPSAIIILIVSPVKCVWFIIFIIILQQLDGNVIGPRILGNSTGLSGFWVLFAIILFGGLFGFVGMIVGVPLFAVIYDMVKRSIRFNLIKRGRIDMVEAYDRQFPGREEREETKSK